ncbi:hypothetical protein HAALTHF_00860n [Vreelandella aquamarina]|nr:hypothetical protein HAALTHF_00860n [Halomonas axialensis]
MQTEATLEEQRSRLDVSVLAPGRFQDFGGGRTAYITDFNSDGTEMQEVLVHEQPMAGAEKTHSYITRAGSGYQETNVDTGSRFLILEDGERYGVTPGRQDAERLTFERYTLRLGLSRDRQELNSLEYATTTELWNDPDPRAQAQFQWRAGLPVMVFILALLAQPLSGESASRTLWQATSCGISLRRLFKPVAGSGGCYWRRISSGCRGCVARAWPVLRAWIAAAVALAT